MLKKIKIFGLFGKFDYDIELKEEGLTILTGPNGYGKTTILKIIHAAVSNNVVPFFVFPFREIHMFIDYQLIGMQKEDSEKEFSLPEIGKIEIIKKGRQLQVKFNNKELVVREEGQIVDFILEYIRVVDDVRLFKKIEENGVYDKKTGKAYLERLIELFANETHPELAEKCKLFSNPAQLSLNTDSNQKLSSKSLASLSAYFNQVQSLSLLPFNTYFIKDQRLVKHSNLDKKSGKLYPNEGESGETVSVIEYYAREMSEKIEKNMAKASQVGQELDSSFPRRLFEEKGEIQEKEFKKRYDVIKEKQSALRLYGLSNTEKEDRPSFSPENAKALLVYLNDMEKKLAVFDDILSKLKAFSSILNDRNFVFKQIEISAEHGFTFKTDDGQKLSLSSLSSGEQQQVVLLYELLFRVPENALVLIDEPEISLHVAWQREIINDLLEIIRLKKINVITATHSPQVIGEHWDLVVDLWKISQ